MPVSRPPVCPQLILAAFFLAWQSGPVAPAVILRFLGHCHAGSAAKWGAGGAGTRAGPRAGKETCAGSMAGLGLCVCAGGRRSVWGCVPPASFLPASGDVGVLPLSSGPLSMPVASEGLGLLV